MVEANATLEKRVKQLETELFEAKSSQWRQGRSKLEGYRSKDELLVEDGQFDDIDLHSAKSINAGGSKSQGIGGFLVDGFSALTGVNPRRQSVAQRSLESDLDDDLDDDLLESEFRKVREEEARKRVERIRQTKRELIQWKGWRLDLLNDWGGGRGIGEVFEI